MEARVGFHPLYTYMIGLENAAKGCQQQAHCVRGEAALN
jgi:hypothetical protein